MLKSKRVILGWALVALAIIVMSCVLSSSIAAVSNRLHDIPLAQFSIIVLVAALMIVATGFSFSILVQPVRVTNAQRVSVISVFLAAQIVKYIPGKIWGLAYQVDRLSKHTHRVQAMVASLNHMIITALISILFLGVGLDVQGSWSILIFGALFGLLWIYRGGVAAYLTRIKKIPEEILRKIPVGMVIAFAESLFIEWLLYFISWYGLFEILHIQSALGNVISVACFYAGAWIVGSLVSVIPGGLGVREGGFIMMGLQAGVSEPDLVSLAILARLVFTLAEALPGSLAAVFIHKKLDSHE